MTAPHSPCQAAKPLSAGIINDLMTSYEHLLPPGGATADRDA